MKKLFLTTALFNMLIINTVLAQNSTIKLAQLLTSYYEVKNALVNSDANLTGVKATELLNAIKKVDTKTLVSDEQKFFNALKDKLILDAEHISESKDIDHQRDHFATLSTTVYTLAKSAKLSQLPIYQEYCPMKKMYWLSDEGSIKNPYYGKKMLTCGKVTDTIK